MSPSMQSVYLSTRNFGDVPVVRAVEVLAKSGFKNCPDVPLHHSGVKRIFRKLLHYARLRTYLR